MSWGGEKEAYATRFRLISVEPFLQNVRVGLSPKPWVLRNSVGPKAQAASSCLLGGPPEGFPLRPRRVVGAGVEGER